jgi:hypothetical protein
MRVSLRLCVLRVECREQGLAPAHVELDILRAEV